MIKYTLPVLLLAACTAQAATIENGFFCGSVEGVEALEQAITFTNTQYQNQILSTGECMRVEGVVNINPNVVKVGDIAMFSGEHIPLAYTMMKYLHGVDSRTAKQRKDDAEKYKPIGVSIKPGKKKDYNGDLVIYYSCTLKGTIDGEEVNQSISLPQLRIRNNIVNVDTMNAAWINLSDMTGSVDSKEDTHTFKGDLSNCKVIK